MASSLPAARIFRTICVVAFPSLFLVGCSPKEQDPIVARIGTDPIHLSEYERIYLKSSGPREQAAAASMEEREKFLDLIVRYKLKLKDATAQGLQLRPDVRQEIEQYKGSLAQSFLTERQIVTPGVRPAFAALDDQKRIMTPVEAVRTGADYLVIGRPISAAPDPAAAAEAILTEIVQGVER